MSEVERLRKEAERLRKNVNAKIARIKRNTGAEVSGSEFDPRRDPDKISRYNQRQVKSAIEDMKQFLNRNTQFSSLANGIPAPRHEANMYVGMAGRYNQVSDAHEADISRYQSGGSDLTIGQANAMLHPTANGGAGKAPYAKENADLSGITSRKSLKVLTLDLKKKLDPKFLKDRIASGRYSATEMFKQLGDLDYMEKVNALSDYQFDILWHGDTGFAEILGLRYDNEKKRAQGNQKERWQDRVVDERYELIGDFLERASERPREKPTESSEKINWTYGR